MKTCWFCEEVEPENDLFYNKRFKSNVHLKCIRQTMCLKKKNLKELINEADRMAPMLVDSDRVAPK
ncbi:MAG: hypothetical protein KAS32_19965 [Candidatus Peribacteraceae bacterium]|nr:hypothetical protein [Candidatus Peribacteraceae bacterium]